jgi:peptidoglycan/LPS O-acetylase OafA/YrhL
METPTRREPERDSGEADAGASAIARIPALDGLRGIAILLVLFLHFGVSADFPKRTASAAGVWLDRLFYNGWAGVDLFFVLSGFLITSILLTSRDQPRYFRRFYGRRALRILPLYYAGLIFGLFIVPYLSPRHGPDLQGQAAAEQIWLWTYTLNIAMAFGQISNAGVLGHFWTLAIEEQYYLFWPWLVKAFSGRAVLIICGGLILGSLLLRLAWLAFGLEWGGAYRFTLTRIDSLAAGSLIALVIRNAFWRESLVAMAPYGFTGGLFIVAALNLAVQRFYPDEWIVVTFGHTILALTFSCLVLWALRDAYPALFASSGLRALGKYSYGIYVWHWPLHGFMLLWYSAWQPAQFAWLPPSLFLGAGVCGSIILGVISFKVLEGPFLEFKRFFSYSRPAWTTDVDAQARATTA